MRYRNKPAAMKTSNSSDVRQNFCLSIPHSSFHPAKFWFRKIEEFLGLAEIRLPKCLEEDFKIRVAKKFFFLRYFQFLLETTSKVLNLTP